MGIGKCNAGEQPCNGLACHPHGKRNNSIIIFYFLCSETREKHHLDGPLGRAQTQTQLPFSPLTALMSNWL